MIRNFHHNDIFDIEDLHAANSQFKMPDYGNPSNVIKKTIIHENRIVGSAFVHVTSEIGLILDGDLSNITKTKILCRLFQILLSELKETDIDDTHVFILPESDLKYAELLKKKFGFERDTSLVMYRGKNEQSNPEPSPR